MWDWERMKALYDTFWRFPSWEKAIVLFVLLRLCVFLAFWAGQGFSFAREMDFFGDNRMLAMMFLVVIPAAVMFPRLMHDDWTVTQMLGFELGYWGVLFLLAGSGLV